MRLSTRRTAIWGLATAVLSLATGACAQTSQLAAPTPLTSAPAGDPWEGANRSVYDVNRIVDGVAFRPVALLYAHVTPSLMRRALRNAISNLGEPLVFVNDVLQLHLGIAGRTATRFAVNSTFGVAGLFDVGAKGGLPHHPNDFGLTLARAGVKPGPYVFLPILGPSDVRDVVGMGADFALNPFTWISYPHDTAVGIGTAVVAGLDARAEADPDLKSMDAMSTDGYATLRSFYQQNRQAQVTGGAIDVNALPDFGPADSTPASAAPDATAPPAPPVPAPQAPAAPPPAGA